MVKAEITIQGAVRRFPVPCFRSSPRLGVGTGNPKPKKSSAVTAAMADTMVNGIKVTSVASTLGRMCLKMIRIVPAPSTLAAMT